MEDMLHENEANAANFKELVGHIGLANNRLKQMIPSSENHAQTVQEVNDYYERAIQDRQMRISTMTELFADREREHTTEKNTLRRVCFLLVACILATAVALAPVEVNEALLALAPYFSPDRVAGYAVAAVIAYACAAKQ